MGAPNRAESQLCLSAAIQTGLRLETQIVEENTIWFPNPSQAQKSSSNLLKVRDGKFPQTSFTKYGIIKASS